MVYTYGQNSAQPSTSVLTMEALVLNKSSRVMPGLRGTPAGITTTSAPVRASARPSLERGGQVVGEGRHPVIVEFVGIY